MLLLGEVALDAPAGGIPAVGMSVALEDALLNHSHGDLPADAEPERRVRDRYFHLLAGAGHGPYLARLGTYTCVCVVYVKRKIPV